MNYNTLKFDLSDGVAEITINRPDAANTMTLEFMQELSSAAIVCDESSDIRAVIITGAGKTFSAGGDIESFAASGDALPNLVKEMAQNFHAAISCFARMDAPVIAAVNGICGGGGLSLAVAADMTLAAEHAAFAIAYTAAGLSPDGSSSFFLPRRIGDRLTRELMLTNRRLTAAEALDCGMINAIHPADELMGAARALARQFADGPTRAYGQVKMLLNDSFDNGLETQMALEARAITHMAHTADVKEGLDAFLNKRKPVFKGH